MLGILLKGGTLLRHDDRDEVDVLFDTDLLIQGEIIKRIDRNIEPGSDVQVIDCHGKIICPGFVDTHHHVWQTQLKGRHSDDTLLDYHPKDVFWGELGGLLEATDAGTTCIVDHAHMTKTPGHASAGIAATLASGIRSVFCYSLVPNISRWDDVFELDSNPIPEWFFETLKDVHTALKAIGGKIQLGLGFDGYHLSADNVVRVIQSARNLGLKVITSHWRRNTVAGSSFSVPQILYDLDLLGADIILSHSTGSTADELKLLKDAGAYTSSTPATESQMGHGDIVGFQDDVLAAMGADCHSNNSASMIHAMQIGLAVVRAQRNASILNKNKFPRYCEPTTLQAFNLATICGARAIGEEANLGSLTEGKQADIVIFDTSSPAMTCAADEDPLAAVVRHASAADIETVIVGGEIRKESGQLLDVTMSRDSRRLLNERAGAGKVTQLASGGKLTWSQIAEQLKRSRRDIQSRIDTCNVKDARSKVLQMWGAKEEDSVLL